MSQTDSHAETAQPLTDATQPLVDAAQRTLARVKTLGASEADVVAAHSVDFEVKVADGSIVTLTQSTSKGFGLRVFVKGRLGFGTSTDTTDDGLEHLAQRAVAMAREAAVDPHNGLAQLAGTNLGEGEHLELFDPAVAHLSAHDKIAWAHELEAAARAADPRVRKFRHSGVQSNVSSTILLTSNGALGRLRRTGLTIWSNPIAQHGDELQTELWYDTKTHLGDLDPLETVGRTAGQRAARMLGAKAVKTQSVPVIFEPTMAAGLLAGLAGAINGDLVYKRASFLADKLGEPIATPKLNLVDDPTLPRAVASAPFDGEGLPTQKKSIIADGKLSTFLYDTYTARKAGAVSTANARRGARCVPTIGSFNLLVQPGDDDPAALVASCDRALLVTRGLGRGVNTVSGEYSRGAGGLWIEGGEVVHPVQEVTIAGDFLTMLSSIDGVGSDLDVRGTTGAPTLRLANMTVSGI